MRRLTAILTATAVAASLAACAVPHRRDDGSAIDKPAATRAQVTAVYERYREVRNAAAELLDPKPLSTVETGPVLAIDTGAFEVSQKLDQAGQEDSGPIDVTQVETPRFRAYPLWMFAVVRDTERKVNRLQVFERATSVDPWLLVATPEALTSTVLPDLRHDGSGHAVTVKPDDGRGMALSAQEAADGYAKTLADPDADVAGPITDDAFVRQMREVAQANSSLDGVQFEQSWAAEKVRYVLRTADGGALAFITLLRSDRYTVDQDRKVTWPDGSPQQALLEDGIQAGSGTLNYYHQILVSLPGGSAKPRALAQYGGVVQGQVG